MTQQIIDVGANANDGTGEPLRQAFTAVNDNFTQIWESGPVGTNVKISGNIVTTTVTNLGLTLAGNGIGNIQANSTIVPGTPSVYDLGAPDNKFQYIYGDYLVGNGALITGIVANTTYNNSNVAAFLPTYTGNLVSLTGPVITTANVIAGNLITSGFLEVAGNIAGNIITGNNLISSGYISAVGNITTAANISGNYFIGNGALLTGIAASSVNANALIGTTLSSNVIYSSLKVVDDLLYLDVVGNVTTQGQFIGSGAGLTAVPGANVTGQVANALTAGTVYTNAQPNITSVGTLTSLTATGNVTANYFVGNGALLTGIAATNVNADALVGTTLSSNVIYSSLQVVDDLLYLDVVGNITTQGRFIGSGAGLTNVPAANISGQVANALIAGTVYASAQPNITSVGTLTSLTATGNITGNYFVGNGALLTGIAATNIAANALVGTTLSSNVIYSSLQVVDDLLYLSVVGNVNTSGQFIGSGAGLTNLTAANISGQVANALVAGTVYASAQPNVTSVGTLTSLTATGNITGNYFIGNGALLTGISTSGVNANALVGTTLSSNVLYSSLKVVDDLLYLDVVGNVTIQGQFIGSGAGLTAVPGANVTGTVANATYATYAGTVTTAAQPNITSVGVLTSLSSTGNVTANYFVGNGSQLTGVIATNVSAGALTGSTLSANVLNSTLVSVGSLNNLSVIGNTIGGNFLTAGQVSATGNITTANYFIGNGRQLTGIQATDVGVLANLSVTGNTTTGNLLTGGTVSAVGNIRTTGNVAGNYFIGNGALLTGIIASAGAAITNGNSNVTVNANGNVTVGVTGTSNVAVFAPAGAYIIGEVSATGNVTGDYLLGNGAFITGLPAGYSNADVANYLPTYSGNLVSLTGPVTTTSNITGGNILTGGAISATGNVTGDYILGNGALLTGVITSVANINNGTSNVTVVSSGGNVSVGVDGTSNVAVFATTGEYITGLLSASGNIIGDNILTSGVISATGTITSSNTITGGNLATGGTVSATGNITSAANVSGGNLATGGTVSATGNITGGSLATGGTISGTGTITGGNVNTGGNVSATGDITGGNLATGGNVSATANITGGNVLTGGTVSAISTITGGNLATGGTVSATANITGGNVLTSGLVSAIANITGGNLLTQGLVSSTGTITSSANISGGNLLTSGLISSAGTVTGSSLLGSVVSASGNITGGNLLTGGLISATSDITGGNVLTSGVVSATGNIISAANISGGNLLTSGLISATGNITGSSLLGSVVSASGNITGGNILTGGLISATSTITSAANITGANVLTSGLISATSTITSAANITGANLITSGLATITGNITGGNVLTGGEVSATANITGGNILTAGLISATGTIASAANITGGNLLTGGYASATGNVTGGNLLTAGLISATSTITSDANITGGNLLTAGLISATGNIIGANVNTSNITPTSGALTIGTTSGNLNLQPAGNIVLSNTIINGVAYPQQDQDAASKIYVDNFATTGIAYHEPVYAATTTTLAAATGGTITYSQPNGVANGIGALLQTTGSFDLIDTANIQTVGTRVLVKNEANAVFNGVYTWSNATAMVRSTDTDQYGADAAEYFSINDYFFVSDGSVNKGSAFLVNSPSGTITFGTSNITFSQFSSSQTYTANTNAGLSLVGTVFNAKVDQNTTAFDGGGNIIVKAGANLTTPNIGDATGTSISLTGNVTGGNINTGGVVSATANIVGGNLVTAGIATVTGNITGGNISTGGVVSATANITGGNITTGGLITATGTITSAANINGANLITAGLITATGNVTGGNLVTGGSISATGNITGDYIIGNISQVVGGLGNNIDLGSNTAGTLVSNAVTLTTSTTVTNGLALLNQVLGKLVPPAPPNFPGGNTLTLSGIATYRMANITQVDNTPGANKAVAAGTSVSNVLRVATYATNTIANVGPGDAGTITAVRNGANVGNVTLNPGASPSGNGTYGSNLVISNNFDYNSANANITAGFWYVFSSRVSGSSAPAGWNELYIADSSTANTNTTVWYYDNSSPSTPSFSSTTMSPPGSANLLYSSTIPHYTNNNNFTISFTVANISGNTYPTSNTLASGSSGGAFAAPATINYSGSNIGSNILNSFASASASTTASITTGFGGSSTGPSMSVNNSYSTGTLTLTTALGNTVLWKSGTATAIEESNVVINSTIGTGSGNAYRIVNPGTGNTPVYTGSEAAFNSQSSTLQTYDATVVGSGSSGVLKHDQTNYSTGYLPAGPNLSVGRSGTQYFTIKFVRTAVSKFDIKYTGNIAGMWVALPGSLIDSSSSANGWINMAVAYGGAGYPGVNSPGNGSDGCSLGGTVSLNTSVTNSSKTCTFGTVSSSSTATNEIYVRLALTAGQSVTALTLETASN